MSRTVNNKLLAKSQGRGQTLLGAEPCCTTLDCPSANPIKTIIIAPGVFDYPSAPNGKMLGRVPRLVFSFLSVSKLQDEQAAH